MGENMFASQIDMSLSVPTGNSSWSVPFPLTKHTNINKFHWFKTYSLFSLVQDRCFHVQQCSAVLLVAFSISLQKFKAYQVRAIMCPCSTPKFHMNLYEPFQHLSAPSWLSSTPKSRHLAENSDILGTISERSKRHNDTRMIYTWTQDSKHCGDNHDDGDGGGGEGQDDDHDEDDDDDDVDDVDDGSDDGDDGNGDDEDEDDKEEEEGEEEEDDDDDDDDDDVDDDDDDGDDGDDGDDDSADDGDDGNGDDGNGDDELEDDEEEEEDCTVLMMMVTMIMMMMMAVVVMMMAVMMMAVMLVMIVVMMFVMMIKKWR